jgi:hypothetical protein
LLDSISGNNLFYAHYQVTNGFSYSYCIKAVYASGIESEFSNAITLIPTVYIPTWRTLPQYAGARSVMMEASQPLPTAPSKFQFENITTNSTSTWLTSSQFREHNLLQGQTYNYRFRVMDTIHGNITTSGWSPVASVSIVDSAKGGFTYKFAFIDNNSIAPPNGIGPITYNLLQMDTSGLRFIKHVPPAGVHPRIYCNPEDSMDIKWRLTNTASGRALAKYIHANTVLLQLGAGVFNGNANYNRDTLGVAIISNQGFSNVKPWYDSLALGDIGVLHNFSNLWGGASGRLAAQLAHEAFECWLYKGTIDRVTNTSYVVRAEKLARAITVWCTKALADNSNPLSFQNRDRIANLQMAMIYDFLYDQMTVAQRDTVRKALLAIAPTDISDLNLHNTPSYTATSNWATFGYEIMATLAVEDEVGYTPQHAVALQTYIRIVLNFLNYGIYESTGNMVEGLGKNQLNAALMVALAKRGYSMLGHPSIRAFATKFWPSIIQPFGYSMVGSDLLGGTGLNSAAYGGWRDRIFDIIGLKWAYPRDNTIDFIWKNFVQRAHAGSNGSNHYYFYQDAFRTSLSQPTYWNHLYAPAFITDYSASTIGSQAQQVYNNNHVYFDSIGGMATIRSGSGLQSAALFFHNRQDMGGHPYGNKNDIVYSALGRIWITRVTTNANSNYYRTAYTGASSGVLVNNAGASVDTTIDRTEEMMVVPGKVIAFNQQPSIVTIAGDARDAYSYIWHGAFGGFQNHHPLLGNTYKKVTRSLNSFRYAPYYSFDNIPLYDKLAVTNYAWNANSPYYNRYVQTTYVNGIMRKVFRTAAMIMDTRPYVIIADDVQKDSSINNFKWVAQIANDLTIEARIIDSSASGFRNDIIFREPSATGNRRFLVRVLNNNNPFDAILPGYIDSIINPVSNITPNNRLPRLVIESNSIDPQFRILLLAYSQGEALPITTWNTDRTRLIVNNNGTTRVIAFDVDSAGRTNISLIEGSLSLAIKATAVKTPHHVKVKWQVSEVKEVASFLVQRSSDGIHYITIDTTYVNDNTTLFQIQDADPIDGKNYYRVMAKLKVGSYKVSNTVLIEFTTDITINITPNPIIHNELTVQLPKLQSSINHKHVIQIFNQFGIKVYSTFIQAAGGSSVKLLLPTYLPQGTYMLIISNDVRNYKAKFLKL